MRELDDPLWLRASGYVLAAAVASYGSVGLALAIGGWYRPWLAFGLGTFVLAGLCVAARPLVPRLGVVTRSAQVYALVAVAAIVAITVWNVSNADQHVFVNRDGGTYLIAGKWIAGHGTLQVRSFVGPFSKCADVCAGGSAGMSVRGGHLDFTLAHMVPVLLAGADNIGGDGLMFATVPILGGVALLMFYLLARRLLHAPLAALGAMLCLAFLMPQVSFTRDSTTEITMQVLLFAAVWLLADPRTLCHRGPAFVVGYLAGTLEAVHIDGLVFLLGLPFVVAIVWLRARDGDRQRLLQVFASCALGLAVGLTIGFVDLVQRSNAYYHVLEHNVRRVIFVAILSVLVAVAAGIGRLYVLHQPGALARLRRARGQLAFLAGELVVAAALIAWFVRPHLEHPHGRVPLLVIGALQQVHHLAYDPRRLYSELSMVWASWYLGPVTLMLALLGAAYAARSFVRGTLDFPAEIMGLMLGPPALLYLWRPSVAPDHIWAMRRFLPAVFPILILAAFGVLAAVFRRSLGRWTALARVVAVALGIAAVLFPIWTIRHVSRMTEQRGMLTLVRRTCKVVGPQGAIVLLQDPVATTFLYGPQTFRSFCNVPVAVMSSGVSKLLIRPSKGHLDGGALRQLALDWASEGRRLFAVSEHPRVIARLFPGSHISSIPPVTNKYLLVQELAHRPDRYHTEGLFLAAAAVPFP